MSQCWLVKLPTPAHKIILLKFADHANDEGLAYPGAIGISEAVGLAERQTRKLIGDLRKWGFLKVFEAEDPVKGKPITYRVTPALGCTPALQCTPKEKKTKTMPTPALECSPVVECSPALERRRGCTTAPLPPALECTQTITEPSVNHHREEKHAQANQPARLENHPPDAGANPVTPPAKPQPTYSEPEQLAGYQLAAANPQAVMDFEALYAIWPAKRKKPEAKQAYFRAINRGIKNETLMNGAIRYNRKIEKKPPESENFISALHDWLDSDGWTSTFGAKQNRKPQV